MVGFTVGTGTGSSAFSAGVIVDPADIAKVSLIATKGGVSADENCYFKAGPDIGNTVLVARLLHVAVFALKSSGIVEVTNDPLDQRVRQHYTDMGFYNGERLPLTDLAALTKTFTYVDVAYQHASVCGRLSLASPPP
jgi:hypothetical protein